MADEPHDLCGVAGGTGVEDLGEAAPDRGEAGDKAGPAAVFAVGFVGTVAVALDMAGEMGADGFDELLAAAADTIVIE